MVLPHVLIFSSIMVTTWLIFIYNWPRLILFIYKRAILVQGLGEGPIPINTLYTEPQKLFEEPLAIQSISVPTVATSGVNHDTLYSLGWLNLKKGPQVLHVPDMNDRYYSIQLTNPSNNTTFAYVGRRTTGTEAGDYLITGPKWSGRVPNGMKKIASPNNSVLIIGRVLVESDTDLPASHHLAEQIGLTPLNMEASN